MSNKLCKINGFSIIELSVVLTIIAFIAGSALAVGASRIEANRINTTNERIGFIMQALELYVKRYGYLPCPADNTVANTSTSFGDGLGSGQGPMMAYCTAWNHEDTAGTMNDDDDVIAGGVPTQQLGISPAIALDGWNRRFTYVVFEDATHATGYTAYDEGTQSAISILPVSGMGAITNDALVVIISHGSEAHGAWKGKGGTQQIDKGYSPGGNNDDEIENAEPVGMMVSAFDEEFVQRFRDQFFDDIVEYRIKWQFEN